MDIVWIALIVILLYLIFNQSKEMLTDVDNNVKNKIATAIKNRFNESIKLIDYLELLNENGNTFLKLTQQDTFNILKKLYSKNQLTEDAIKNLM